MDLKQIKFLLEKYYNGESTLGEEKILLKYFKSDNISNEFIADKDIFLYNLDEKHKIDSLPDYSNEIWDAIQLNNKETIQKQPKISSYRILQIAAGIAILLASYFLSKDHLNTQTKTIQFADTYDNPEDAYIETKKTLLYVSQLLNSGTEHLEPINKIEEGANKLNSISSFNKGLKELDPIKKYNIADKYIKQ